MLQSKTSIFAGIFSASRSLVTGLEKKIALHLFFRVSNTLIGLFLIYEIGAISTLFSKNFSFDSVVFEVEKAALALLCGIFLLFLVGKNKASAPHIQQRFDRRGRQIILSEFNKREIPVTDPTGKILSIFERGTSAWNTLAYALVIDLPVSSVLFIVVLGYLLLTEWQFFPIIVLYLLITAVFILLAQKILAPIRKERPPLLEERSRVFVRSIMERKTILMYGASAYEEEKFAIKSQKVLDNFDKSIIVNFILYRFPQYFLDAIRLAMALLFAFLILRSEASVGVFVSASMALAMLDNQYQRLLDLVDTWTNEFIHFSRLSEYLKSMPFFTRLHEGEFFSLEKGEIHLRSLEYIYPNATIPAISEFSCVFAGGKKTAIVGRSGVGKTTLIKLLLGHLLPTKGEIFVDSQNLKDVRLDSYFSHIGYLSQEPSVFDGTIRENITYGLIEEKSESDIQEALLRAKCEFIASFPEGIETEIGEKGVRLSGGERQRIAIARIFLRNPEILILDEPTSALDSFSESAITEALHELFKNKTVIVVAHRLQTVKESDTIIVLGKEGIIEQGTHEVLLEKGSEYAKMVDLQSGTIRDDVEV